MRMIDKAVGRIVAAGLVLSFGALPAPAAEGKAEEAAPAAKAAPEAKKEDPARAEAPAPAKSDAPPGPGVWGSMDDFMKRTGKKVEETRLFGLRLRPSLSETVAYTDNAFYQDHNEELVVDRNPDRVFANDDADGDGDPQAHPRLGSPRGQVAEIVNTARLSLGLDMPLNASLIPLVGEGQNNLRVFEGSITSVEYFLHSDSPDAFNIEGSFNAPFFLNSILQRLTRANLQNHSFYFQVEGNYADITDPLDVARFKFQGPPPSLSKDLGGRNDFSREEWWFKGTLGWKGPRLDAKVSYRFYRFRIIDDEVLESSAHRDQTFYGELGWNFKNSEHRVYSFYDTTFFNFDYRGGPRSRVTVLRDFSTTRTGAGWQGPLGSKKVTGNVEVYYLTQNLFNEGHLGDLPFAVNQDDGSTITKGGVPQRRPLDQHHGIGTSFDVAYRPFTTKATQIQAEYSRIVDWSVVAQNKVVDAGSITIVHPINDKLTAEVKYSASFENVAFREKRLYQEFGAGVRYKLFAHTEVDFRYTIRHMRSRSEPTTQFSDAANEPFLLRPDGDFTANIISLGITVSF